MGPTLKSCHAAVVQSAQLRVMSTQFRTPCSGERLEPLHAAASRTMQHLARPGSTTVVTPMATAPTAMRRHSQSVPPPAPSPQVAALRSQASPGPSRRYAQSHFPSGDMRDHPFIGPVRTALTSRGHHNETLGVAHDTSRSISASQACSQPCIDLTIVDAARSAR